MEFQDVVRRRRMVRKFSDRPLDRDVVGRIVSNAQRGPSSGFTQGFDFVVFDGPTEVERFWRAVPHLQARQAANAPLVIIPVANSSAYIETYRQRPEIGREVAEDFPAPYWFTDTGCAVMLMLLTAVDAGLGAFWFSVAPTSKEVPAFCAALGIPEGFHPVGAVAVGHPDAEEGSTSAEARRRSAESRRDASLRVHLGHW
jgi:nitroreductase